MESGISDLAAIIRDLRAICSGSANLQMGMRRYVRFRIQQGAAQSRSSTSQSSRPNRSVHPTARN